MKILVIDDEKSIRDSLQWYLEDLGHEVIVESAPFHCHVYQGGDCTNALSCTDVLLIDYNMPDMNGLEFIQVLKERGCKGITKNMILMSGDAMAIDMDVAEKLGCTVVQKPMSFDFLNNWLLNIKA
ncbi:MAG: hypothetical protein C0623_03090 [Desulfuromonas sp.]|nr:MAG: hypothetical protein C0623_03090 [Desulfuromonas sp.]